MRENGHLTKADLVAALSAMRTELRAELRADTQSVVQAAKDELTEKMRDIETNLLTEFHRYAKGQQTRMHSIETREADLTLRLALIEERLLALESRRPPSV